MKLFAAVIFLAAAAAAQNVVITGSSSGGTWNDFSTPEKAYDGNLDSNFWGKSCYHSKGASNEKIFFYIEKASVTGMRILNRGDCCGDRLNGAQMKVCDETGCTNCGAPISGAVQGGWSEVSCSAIVGKRVEFWAASNQYLQVCEVEIKGQASSAADDNDLIKINSASSRGQWNDFSSPMKAADGIYDTNFWGESCYHSKGASNEKAIFYIDGATVSSVEILNRGDCCGERLNGAVIKICSPSGCQDCGSPIAGATNGAWLNAQCGSLTGNRVEVWAASNQYLQICEIKIHGQNAEVSDTDLITIQSATSSGTWNDFSTPMKATDGNYDANFWGQSCYHSKGASNEKAIFYFNEGTVNYVKILNRGDCCGERLNGAQVKVCGRGGCANCGGVIAGATAAAWSTVQCGSLAGNRVEVWAASNQYLQICEIELHGAESDNVESDYVAISSSEATGQWNDFSGSDKAYDGNYDANFWGQSCYHSKTNSNEKAVFHHASTTVTRVEILNRGDCCGERLNGAQVKVCGKGGCKNCGAPISGATAAAWSEVNCQLAGERTEVWAASGQYLQICEIKIQGSALPSSLSITGSASQSQWNSDSSTEKAYDGNIDSNFWSGSCFHTGAGGEAAQFHFDLGIVQQVRIMNRGDCCGDRLNGVVVSVCNSGVCSPCGAPISGASDGQWAEVTCPSLMGNSLDVSAEANGQHLQICEIQILGYEMTQQIEATGYSSTGQWNDFSSPDKAFDGNLDANFWGQSCYHSKTNSNEKAIFNIAQSTITGVKILNRGDCCGSRLNGAQVMICDAAGCNQCGESISSASDGEWSSVSCYQSGDRLEVWAKSDQYLQICEMEITGVPPSEALTISGSSATKSGKTVDISSVHDGDLSTSPASCFITKEKKQTATFTFEKSMVNSVKILNAAKKPKKLKKSVVFVCDGANCEKCGKIKKVGKKQWSEIECGFIGDSVKIKSFKKKPLQMCEVEIDGYTVPGIVSL